MFLSKVVEFEIGETAKQKVNKTVLENNLTLTHLP